MINMDGVLQESETLAITWVHSWLFGCVRVAHLFSFLCCFYCFKYCTQCCLCLWFVHSWLPLRFCLIIIYKCVERSHEKEWSYAIYIRKGEIIHCIKDFINLSVFILQASQSEHCQISSSFNSSSLCLNIFITSGVIQIINIYENKPALFTGILPSLKCR